MDLTLRERLLGIESQTRRECPVSKLLSSLDDETAGALKRILSNGSVSTLRIYQELRASGHTIGRESIAVHRRGKCLCLKGTK